MARAAFLLLFATGWIAGCQPDEYSILISAGSQLDVDTVVVTVIPLSGGRTFPSGTFAVNRTSEDIEDNEPIRIAIELDGPREVLVHIQATSGASRLIASRCYRVTGVLHDSVLLVQTDGLDADGDNWLANPADSCFGADGTRCTAHMCAALQDADCNDADASFNPGAQEICADGLDQDCRNGDAPCEDADGDGHDKCSSTDVLGSCDCNDDVATTYPGAEEVCGDAIDQDCDGRDQPCDNDGDGYASDVDCDDGNAAVNPGAEEVCTPEGGTPVDEDCDRMVDELIACADDDLDNDGVVGCRPGGPAECDCNDCDYGIRPGAFDACGNGVDENCDGVDAVCPIGDADRDGIAGTASGGPDCDDTNPQIWPGAPEYCDDGIAQGCSADAPCSGDTDGDRWIESDVACAMSASVHPWRDDVCNAIDDNCNGATDEVLNPRVDTPEGVTYLQGLDGCVSPDPTVPGCSTSACVVDFTSNIYHCSGCGVRCNPDDARNIADRCLDGRCDCSHETSFVGACVGAGESCCPGVGCEDTVNGPPTHCGGCNRDCNSLRPASLPAADRCSGGACMCGGTARCPGDSFPYTSACCGGTCTNPQTDSNNCGACGNQCGPNSRCVNGSCQCNAGNLRDCDGNQATGCEVDVSTDELNCGACGAACSTTNATPTCSGGTCMLDCNAGWGDCNGNVNDGCETRLNTLSNCGACGTSCSVANGTASCTTGACQVMTCGAGWGNCDGSHANGCELRLNSTTNCGGCGTPCSLANAAESCSTGTCVLGACEAGWGNCNGSDADGCEQRLNTTAHCGGCNVACSPANATGTCATETCQIASCNMYFENCDGVLGNGCETDLRSVSSCGSCTTMCMPPANANATCDGMSCGFACITDYHLCGASCVSDDSVATCGTRCTACPQPANSTARCMGEPETCSFTCNTGYCEVAGSCLDAATSANACGYPACRVCTAPANATPTCSSGTCGFMCDSTWGDCNDDPADGCEQSLRTNEHCGNCRNSCSGMRICCPDGVCRNAPC